MRLLAQFSLSLNIGYLTEHNGYAFVSVDLEDSHTYEGKCDLNVNNLQIKFNGNWLLSLNYTFLDKKKTRYALNELLFSYSVTEEFFPNATNWNVRKTVNSSKLNEFSAKRGDSFKCWSGTDIRLGDVTLRFTNYHAQPFLDEKSNDFDTG